LERIQIPEIQVCSFLSLFSTCSISILSQPFQDSVPGDGGRRWRHRRLRRDPPKIKTFHTKPPCFSTLVSNQKSKIRERLTKRPDRRGQKRVGDFFFFSWLRASSLYFFFLFFVSVCVGVCVDFVGFFRFRYLVVVLGSEMLSMVMIL
jgi:hypothetical protein